MQKNNPLSDTKCALVAALARRIWYGFGLTILAGIALSGQVRADAFVSSDSRPVTLVELYTSQGCSSCPPADQFLEDLATDPNVLPLSFHVDYWDSAQWQDPFSRKAFSARQMAYQESLKTDYVYTPQMVVSGRYAFPGGQRAAVKGAIEKIPNAKDVGWSPVLRRAANGRVEIEVPAVERFSDSTLYLAVYHTQKTTRVKGGENRGRTLKNANIVKRLIALAPYTGTAQVYTFARTDLDATPSDGIAVFIQAESDGSILSAAALAGRTAPAAQAKLIQTPASTLR